MLTDTIAAISTATGNSGINIIRISGTNSVKIIKKIFKTNHKLEHSKIIYGHIVDGKGNKIDQVLVSHFKNPSSFTGEDVCEVNCHGGRKVTLEILEEILKNGARLAEPGEFTKRAFLNGKVDLTQAEAIMDVIAAKTKKQSKLANMQLEGKLSNKLNEISEDLITLMAQIEVSVDYPEYDYEEIENERIIKILNQNKTKLSNLLDTYDDGKIIKDGINVAIIGKPNVGKSSLLNKIVEYDKAIVTDIEGTTRDVIEETVHIGDLILNISDTAGIRETEDVVEKIGVEKSKKILESSDLVLYLIDLTKEIDDKDVKLINSCENKHLILILNKSDLVDNEVIKKSLNSFSCENILVTSMTKDEDVEKLKSVILNMFNNNKFDTENDLIITSERHKSLINNAVISIESSISAIDAGMPTEIITIEIRNVLKYLGEITGANVSEEVMTTIFQKFCLGK